MKQYKYRKKAGALQEAALPEPTLKASFAQQRLDNFDDFEEPQIQQQVSSNRMTLTRAEAPVHAQSMTDTATLTLADNVGTPFSGSRVSNAGSSVDTTSNYGRYSMYRYTVEEGQKVLVIDRNGSMQVVEGPQRIWRWGKTIQRMKHHVAHPGEFLIVRFRDGKQEHLRGPAHVWFDPREHLSIDKEELFQIADRESIVVYSKHPETGSVERRIVSGPVDFMTEPGEWLHTFSWHGSKAGPDGMYRKVPNALVFQKLWLLPDQMYHDVPEVRTADGAVLTVRLMIFFELQDIEKMLTTTHDPIGDFVNAATSDVVEFSSRHDFESFKESIDKLNDLGTYKHLTGRAEQCGYRIGKVVYRGYGAPEALQQMHEQALESRTRLELEKDTEKQAQELEDLKLERRLARAAKERQERAENQSQDLELQAKRAEVERTAQRAQRELAREQHRLDAEAAMERSRASDQARLEWIQHLHGLGVQLTDYLTQGKPDRVIELRDSNERPAHVHIDANEGRTRA